METQLVVRHAEARDTGENRRQMKDKDTLDTEGNEKADALANMGAYFDKANSSMTG